MLNIIAMVMALLLTGIVLLDCYHVWGIEIKNRYVKLALYLGWLVCQIAVFVLDILSLF